MTSLAMFYVIIYICNVVPSIGVAGGLKHCSMVRMGAQKDEYAVKL